VANCIYSTFAAINDLEDDAEKDDALNTVISSSVVIASMLVNGAVNHYNQHSTVDGAYNECANRVVSAGNIYSEIEDNLKRVFPEKQERIILHQKMFMTFLNNNSKWYNSAFISRTCDRINSEIAAVHPEYGEKIELQKNIDALNAQIGALKVKRTARVGCVGYFFLIVGAIMLFLGCMLMSLDGSIWPIFVAIPELALAFFFLKKTPSEEEVAANIVKKEELIRQRDALQEELNQLQ
jgi:hypothetical protein